MFADRACEDSARWGGGRSRCPMKQNERLTTLHAETSDGAGGKMRDAGGVDLDIESSLNQKLTTCRAGISNRAWEEGTRWGRD